MGGSIIRGAVRGGVLAGPGVIVVDPDQSRHDTFAELGATCVTELGHGFDALGSMESDASESTTGMVLLAVKPQMLGTVAEASDGALHAKPRAVLSILAGAPITRIRAELGGRVIRLMPNTPSQIGKGITAMCAPTSSNGAKDNTEQHIPSRAEIASTRRLFESVGTVIDLPESLLDAFTGVAGSGPAYVFLLAEGMLAGALEVGFDRQEAMTLVRATIAGAAGLLESDTETDAETLRARVTSKGGTTAAATEVLLQRGMPEALRDAIVAARDRGRELASG